MRTVDIFSSLSAHMLQDDRVQKYGLMLLRQGTKGVRGLNPMVVWLDAGMAVCDAYSSYCDYGIQKQKVEQLETEIRILKREIETWLKRLKLEVKLVEQDQSTRLNSLKRQVTELSCAKETFTKEVKHLDSMTHKIHGIVRQLRSQGDSHRLQAMQRLLDKQLHAILTYYATAVDEPVLIED